MIVKANGLVIREAPSGESDKILTVLTAEFGKISVFARGVRKLTSKYMTSTQLFSYSSFVMKKSENICFLQESEYIEGFFNLRRDIVSLSLANYFAEVISDTATEEKGDPEMLPLILNSLYVLCEGKRPIKTVKAVFELRLASLLGFTPNLVACVQCGSYESNTVYIDIMNGEFVCDQCKQRSNAAFNPREQSETPFINRDGTAVIVVPVSRETLTAIRHIIYSKPKKIFSFSISDEFSDELSRVCEKYLLNHLERNFSTLDFYKSVIL